MAEFTVVMDQNCNITEKPMTVCDLQANPVKERVHQTMGNMPHTFDVPNLESCNKQVPGALAAIAHGMCNAIHTTTGAVSVQLVFGHVPH